MAHTLRNATPRKLAWYRLQAMHARVLGGLLIGIFTSGCPGRVGYAPPPLGGDGDTGIGQVVLAEPTRLWKSAATSVSRSACDPSVKTGLASDPELSALRGHEDFQKLIS
jgi:hypothetical protein